MNPKVQEHHRSKPAYIYLRQSTPSQVRHHQESTERQYALREKALELGWSESLIRILDRDLGKTGTEMARREDFKTLVADVVSFQQACMKPAGITGNVILPPTGSARRIDDEGPQVSRCSRHG